MSRVRIAVDALGGDHAPCEIVRGSVLAARDGEVEIVLVGPRDRVEAELERHATSSLPIRVVDSDDTIAETERPTIALAHRPNAGVNVAARLVGQGEADAVVGAGNSGALLVAGARQLGRLEGVHRASVGTSFPFAPRRFLLDAGANIDCRPDHLLSFATLGVAYSRTVLGVEEPTVGLLSVGAEDTKGPVQVRQAHELLRRSGLSFVGNVEGSDVLEGGADVVVCDGTVGNAILKYTEGYSRVLLAELERSFDGAVPRPLAGVVERLRESLDLSLGGQAGILLGLRGVCMLCHGRSTAEDFRLSIEKARLAVERGLVSAMAEELRRVRAAVEGPAPTPPGR